jgi:hypothetical protein
MMGRPYLTAAVSAVCTASGLVGMMLLGDSADLAFLGIAVLPIFVGSVAYFKQR